ncbi:MAG: helicase-exonuclease AddAB subunit AddA [Clostridia bacterium]|nr:helicase-exonuclease AddAB subunit AddA [Clostridia bacterium]
MPNWTNEQLDAINDRGHSLIVCAAAGSGKTAVLVSRIAQLVAQGCPIDRMLVVTFTNAAASEMRQRIGEALTSAAKTQPSLGEQVTALSRSSISTLHRFCGSLLREHFDALGIDAAFRIADEQECAVLSAQAMDDALYACYDVSSEAFMRLDACFEQEAIADIASQIHRFMMTRPDPFEWLDRAAHALSTDEETLEDSEAVSLLLDSAKDRLCALAADARQTLSLCRQDDGPAHYLPACAQDAAIMDDLLAACPDGYGALRRALADVSFAALGRKKKGDVFSEDIAETVKARRDALKKALTALKEEFSVSLTDAAQDMQLTQLPLEGLSELIRTYDALYCAAKRRRNVLDFNDLEHLALRALRMDSVRAALREKYRYIFIDEYQDSSAIQEAIIGCFAREDGLFLVGDVKQSIYRFRQAEPALFLEKAARFDREDEAFSRRIDLQKNFRSRANVLAGVNAVFEQIMRADVTEIQYDERERLIAGLPTRQDDPPLELHILYRSEDADAAAPDAAHDEDEESADLKSIEQEAMIAAQRIHVLVGTPFYDAKQGCERALCYRDMAVLMRVAHGCAPLAADILQSQGIPVFCDAGEGYFDIPEVRAMMALLTAIDNSAKDEALLSALTGPALELSDSELAQIRIHTPDTKTPYHVAVCRYREEMEDDLAHKLREFESRMNRWRLLARHEGTDRLIEAIYGETDFLALAGALPGGAARQANLHLLTTRARAFMRTQGGSLHAFLRYAARLRAGGDSMTASAITESEDVVRIMTTHKSKGLEFPVVFVLGLGRKMRTASPRDPVLTDAQLGVGLPCVDTELGSERDTLLRRAMRIKLSRQQLAEEVRILYVAMTRARERLILIGDAAAQEPPARWKRGGEKAVLSAMRTGLDMIAPALMQAGAVMTIREEAIQAGDSSWRIFAHTASGGASLSARTQEGVMRLIAQLESTPLEDHDLAALLAFTPQRAGESVRKASVSSILRDEKRAADDEIHQRDVEVMRLPRFMQEAGMTGAQIGTVFHRMMRMIDLDALRMTTQLEKEIAAQLSGMLGDGVLTRAQYDAVPAHMLVRFFAQPLGVRLLASPRVEREWAFTWKRTTPDGSVQLLQGIIDCCFMENGRWILVDYKTDSAKDAPAAITKHRPQLALYADALESLTDTPVQERILYLVRGGVGYQV